METSRHNDLVVKVGDSYQIFYCRGNLNNRRIHIRGVVDDRFVVRRWGRHQQGWLYYVMDGWELWSLRDSGHLKKRR